jgi:hypothetical protein
VICGLLTDVSGTPVVLPITVKPGTMGGGGEEGVSGERGERCSSERIMDLPVCGSWPGGFWG